MKLSTKLFLLVIFFILCFFLFNEYKKKSDIDKEQTITTEEGHGSNIDSSKEQKEQKEQKKTLNAFLKTSPSFFKR